MPTPDEIHHTLGVVVGKLDMVLEQNRQVINRFEDIEKRIRSLEAHRGYALGVIAAAALLWTVVFEWFKGRLFG